jgi:hypothetical protein
VPGAKYTMAGRAASIDACIINALCSTSGPSCDKSRASNAVRSSSNSTGALASHAA